VPRISTYLDHVKAQKLAPVPLNLEGILYSTRRLENKTGSKILASVECLHSVLVCGPRIQNNEGCSPGGQIQKSCKRTTPFGEKKPLSPKAPFKAGLLLFRSPRSRGGGCRLFGCRSVVFTTIGGLRSTILGLSQKCTALLAGPHLTAI
jgi:hypothetical protein